MEYILASASPRRKELLERVIPYYVCLPADVDESIPEGIPANKAPEYLSLKKARHIAKDNPDAVIIGADTCVILDDKILGKPQSIEEAKEMLTCLSGKAHLVITGCSIVKGHKEITFSEVTEVEFYPLTEQEINEYIATGESMDKAGAYGIQGKGSLLVKGIAGDYFNVVGLPIARLAREIKKL
ncbi:MAG: septum formation protein Maf [Clostridia bacterium]|nr:septum formation protein Maf [Clostridia bacterium]